MTDYEVKAPKKLIEVALPLKEINEACIREKSIRHGHPSTLHLYWARRPLAAARAVLFAQLVNDPGWDEELKIGYKRKADANRERERIFEIIRKLVKWENTNNEIVLNEARAEIRKSWIVTCELNKDHPEAAELFNPDKLPAFHDPFAGGGSIPLEAQRLGLEAWASDLNPVAVLINKAMIEIPPKFVGRRPIGPIPKQEKQDEIPLSWPGLTGLAEDVRRYGHWVWEEAFKRIGQLYPPIKISDEMITERPDLAQFRGKELTVIAYIWARTVKSPNPLYSHVDVPLTSSFLLSTKKGKEAWIETIVNDDYFEFKVRVGLPSEIEEVSKGTKARGRSSHFICLLSNTPIESNYIKQESKNGRLGSRLMAVVCDSINGRVYISPRKEDHEIAQEGSPTWTPHFEMNQLSTDLVSGRGYGFYFWDQLFTHRQLIALSNFSEIVFSFLKDNKHVNSCGGVTDTTEQDFSNYLIAIKLYLAFAVSRLANRSSTICIWNKIGEKIEQVFARQAIPMTWDFVESNVFSDSTGGWIGSLEWIPKVINMLSYDQPGYAEHGNAVNQVYSRDKIVSTDPPYYDNICYADLSDYFYIWLRRILSPEFPDLFSTVMVPKEDELIASHYRHNNLRDAEQFFLSGMQIAMSNMKKIVSDSFPVTFYYAFKQSEVKEANVFSVGWETFLSAVFQSGFYLTGTWPMRTERDFGMKTGANVLASSIILVCRKRSSNASTISRKDFLIELKQAIPVALETMINGSETSSPVAPVDLAQSAIGPGMAVYSKYKAILESDGSPMTVHTALILINKALDEYFKEREGDWDNDTRFCLQWFSEYGWKEGVYGEAEVLAKAKGLSVEGVRDSGVLTAGSGKVRLYRPAEYPSDWNPLKDDRTPVWEVLHQLIRAHQSSGESAAAAIASAVPELAATARQLAFLLYTLCERQGWAEDARPYNDLVTAWLSIEKQAQDKGIKDDQIEAEF